MQERVDPGMAVPDLSGGDDLVARMAESGNATIEVVGVFSFQTYFDIGTPLRQLGVARDPNSRSGKIATAVNHPLVVGKAPIGSLFHR